MRERPQKPWSALSPACSIFKKPLVDCIPKAELAHFSPEPKCVSTQAMFSLATRRSLHIRREGIFVVLMCLLECLQECHTSRNMFYTLSQIPGTAFSAYLSQLRKVGGGLTNGSSLCLFGGVQAIDLRTTLIQRQGASRAPLVRMPLIQMEANLISPLDKAAGSVRGSMDPKQADGCAAQLRALI